MSRAEYSFPGLAAATGTRVDSAAKHTLACKVNDCLMMNWCENQENARNHMHNQKMKYCVHKDELCLNTSQSLNTNSQIDRNWAYPAIVSNLGDMTNFTKHVLRALYHDSHTGYAFFEIKKKIAKAATNKQGVLSNGFVKSDEPQRSSQEMQNLPYFTAQGYALTIAYASNLTGDTVGTVLIGGMITVMNGHFEMRAGQQVQWYFDFEADDFYQSTTESNNNRVCYQGMRKNHKFLADTDRLEFVSINPETHNKKDVNAENRRKQYVRELGDSKSYPKNYTKHNVFYPKAFHLCEDGHEHYGDKIRIFAKCINGGRPWEMVDIMLMTQSL